MYQFSDIGDPRFDYAEILEILSSSSALVYSVQKGTFPVSARDLVTVTENDFEGPNIMYVTITSVSDGLAPPEGGSGRVRAEILLAGWRIEKNAGKIKATYIVHVDPKGTVPTCICYLFSID
jgi:hypothetical protein